MSWFFLAGFLALVIAALIVWPVFMVLFFSFVVVVQITGTRERNRHLRRLAADRTGEDIGTFARAFNRRTDPFDSWVVRAVWDALQPYTLFREGRLPLQPADRFLDDLFIDPDDIVDLIQEVAERTGHSLDQVEVNPLFGHVQTVGDLVRFVTFQPQSAFSCETRPIRG